VKKVTTFLFVLLNGTWALMAYLLHVSGVHPALLATVVATGLLLGNLAGYAGLRLAERSCSAKGAKFKLRLYEFYGTLARLILLPFSTLRKCYIF